MQERPRRKMLDVLRVLAESDKPLGAARIADSLALAGRDMSQRTIRYYLGLTDEQGLTEPVGGRGRRLTARGRAELESAYVVDKVGFVAARVATLTYQMSFKLKPARGDVVVNLSTIKGGHTSRAFSLMAEVFAAGLSMGQRVKIFRPGQRVGRFRVGPDEVGVATMCSVSVNGVLLSEGIPATSRFGGLLQMDGGKPVRFTQIIHYDGTTLDPLEIFIKGHMTSVTPAAREGKGVVGASFREIPDMAAEAARRLSARMEKAGHGGILLVGRPGQPLLEIPVSPGRVGLVVIGGLNPLAAVEEAGLATGNQAMGMLFPFEEMDPWPMALAG